MEKQSDTTGITKSYMEKILEQRQGFIIIALTGKARAGTADVGKLLTEENFCNWVMKPADTSMITMSEARERNICYRYLQHNWKPFIEINVVDVIFSFLIETDVTNICKFFASVMPNTDILDTNILEAVVKDELKNRTFERAVLSKLERIDNIIIPIPRNKVFGKIETCCKDILEKIDTLEDLIKEWKKQAEELNKNNYMSYEMLCWCHGIIPVLNARLEYKLKERNDGCYIKLYQELGNNLRAYGVAVPSEKQVFEADGIFFIPRRVNKFLKILRHYNSLEIEDATVGRKSNSLRIVINNLKNIFEAFYFRCRYSSFYLMAVDCDEREREDKFGGNVQYRQVELNENLSQGKRIFKRAEMYLAEHDVNRNKKSECQNAIKDAQVFNKEEKTFLMDLYSPGESLRLECYQNNYSDFILQDVVRCIENSDLFLKRDYREDYTRDHALICALGRMVTLMMHPGLLTPTKIERCMQIAMTAKLNSGCLSRQVGAVITDSEYNILSIGWNDAPCGDESCIRRNMFELFQNHDEEAYSEFERYNPEFREYLKKIEEKFNKIGKERLRGLPFAFCFKDVYQDIIKQKDQIYTRALHGEERALAICGNERLKGGYLFTTSSPCELCAKKIKEAGIAKIFYIEQYKGISKSHIIEAGKHHAEYVSFIGATGLAYIKFYTPLLPYKDELKALGFEPTQIHREKELEKENENVRKRVSTVDSEQVRQGQQVSQEW